MPLTATTNSGARVFAPELERKNQDFFCPFCKAPMSFVDATLKIKHFRHMVKTSCNYETETEEHKNYKYAVYKKLLAIGNENVFIEHPVGKLIADVYWKRSGEPDIAFEIQATNYSISKYEEKIAYYVFRNIVVVYIFVGEDFCNEIRPNVYSLKEIEKRIFHEKKYRDSVIGCYLDGESITIPLFSPKFAKGGDGYCTSRFIMMRALTENMPLNGYLQHVNRYVVARPYFPECSHEAIAYEKHAGKITRYKVVCSVCRKFVKWLPNDEARKLGFDI